MVGHTAWVTSGNRRSALCLKLSTPGIGGNFSMARPKLTKFGICEKGWKKALGRNIGFHNTRSVSVLQASEIILVPAWACASLQPRHSHTGSHPRQHRPPKTRRHRITFNFLTLQPI